MEHPDNGFTRLRITLLLLLMSFYHSYTPFGKKKVSFGASKAFLGGLSLFLLSVRFYLYHVSVLDRPMGGCYGN